MRVYVTTYSERTAGDTVRVFRKAESADQWRTYIAEYWWSRDMQGIKKPDNAEIMSREYWNKMQDSGEDTFTITACEIED